MNKQQELFPELTVVMPPPPKDLRYVHFGQLELVIEPGCTLDALVQLRSYLARLIDQGVGL